MLQGTRRFFVLLSLLAVAGPAASAPAAPPPDGEEGPYRVETLADGIHLFRPADPAGGLSNSLVVEREDGLLVVDAQPTPEAARKLLERIALRFARPIRFLVLTHPHADAAGGASAFPPSTLVVASGGYRDAVADDSYDFGAEARVRTDSGAKFDAPPRAAPTLVSWTPLRLEDRRHGIDVLPVAKLPAHSAGDLVVWIPDARVLAVGDLVWSSPNAYTGSGNVSNWIVALNAMLELKPARVVPLRGPAADAQPARLLREGFAWIRGQVEQAFVDAVPSGRIADHVLESPQSAKFLDLDASPSWVRGMIESVIAETIEYRRKRGID